jgi:hypothetical protein
MCVASGFCLAGAVDWPSLARIRRKEGICVKDSKVLGGMAIATLFVVILVGLIGLSASAGSRSLASRPPDLSILSTDLGPQGAQAEATPVSILELHADQTYISQTVVVAGEYVAWSQDYLAIDYADFQANRPVAPHAYLLLEGQVPGEAYDGWTIVVTGTVGLYFHDYPYLGETEGRRIIVSDWAPLTPPPQGHRPLTLVSAPSSPDPHREGEIAAVDCNCKWALIVSGGINDDNNHQRYRNDIEKKWRYKRVAADYPEECINVFYDDGAGDDLPNVPNGQVEEATQQEIEDRLEELAPQMQACKEKGIKPTLQFLVTDHGDGYHSTNQGANHNKLGLGGQVDTDGDEGGTADEIQESNLRIDGRELAPNKSWTKDLYPGDGQKPDTRIGWQAGSLTVWRCLTPTCPPNGWTVVATDTNGDNIIDSNDGGIDLNGDGDTNDSVSFDEVINLWGDEALTDDELTNMLRPLCPSGVDLYVEMAQCFGGGFQEDLARLRDAGCHIHFAAAAGEDELSWGDADKDYYEDAFITKITELISDTHRPVTPDLWRQAADHAASQPDSQQNNTHPTSDIDCLIMIGPYIKDGQVCIKVINYCNQDVVADLRLAAYNFGISSPLVEEHTETVTLASGETREWCWPLPTEPGTYCFFGRASMFEPRYEYHPRWLNDQVVRAEESEPVAQSFVVGSEPMPAVVLLDPDPYLPLGWDYRLSHEYVWLGDGPVSVTMVISPELTAPGVGRLWINGWLLAEGNGLQQGDAFTPTVGYQYQGYVYLEVDTRPEGHLIYLPLVVKDR